MAAFILPVKLEDVLEQWAQLLARGDALYVVRLNEQFDMTGQRQYRPGAGRQHRAGHIVRIGNLTISRRQSSSHHRLDAPEQFLMLDLVVGKTHQRFECELIVKYMGPTLVEHLGTDKALDQAKNVRIGSTLNLAEQARLVCAEEGQAVDPRESVGQEFAREVEAAVLQQVAVDLPFRFLRGSDELRITGGVARVRAGQGGGGVHTDLRLAWSSWNGPITVSAGVNDNR
ncbi:hypothetical protein D9M71_36060 [compost metagenome]